MCDPAAATRAAWTPAALLAALGLLCLALLLGAQSVEAATSVKEAQIKAAFLYNFTKFVEWPDASFAAPGDPLIVGLFGDTALQQELESTVKDRRVNGRAILVKRVVTSAEANAVHVLFVEAAEEARFNDVRARLVDSAVLLVGESAEFLRSGGCIRLMLDEPRLRFEINAVAAEHARLRVSSQLQKLAVAVHRQPPGEL
jgi:hypothetical protein